MRVAATVVTLIVTNAVLSFAEGSQTYVGVITATMCEPTSLHDSSLCWRSTCDRDDCGGGHANERRYLTAADYQKAQPTSEGTANPRHTGSSCTTCSPTR